MRRPLLGLNNILDERDLLAAAHDAAKINVSQQANVRLARSGGALGAQCMERKQPPPQDAPAAHIFNSKPLFLFPSEHPKPYSYLVCKPFDDNHCFWFPKSAYDSFINVSSYSYKSDFQNDQRQSMTEQAVFFVPVIKLLNTKLCRI